MNHDWKTNSHFTTDTLSIVCSNTDTSIIFEFVFYPNTSAQMNSNNLSALYSIYFRVVLGRRRIATTSAKTVTNAVDIDDGDKHVSQTNRVGSNLCLLIAGSVFTLYSETSPQQFTQNCNYWNNEGPRRGLQRRSLTLDEKGKVRFELKDVQWPKKPLNYLITNIL